MNPRPAIPADAAAIAAIYDEGIDDRVATFETRHRTPDDIVLQWFDGWHPVIVVEDVGFWKPVSRVLPENTASRAMLKRNGFREVGTHYRHARPDCAWRDVIIVEKLIGEAADA